MFNYILDLIYPPTCILCQIKSEKKICDDCIKELKYSKNKNFILKYEGYLKDSIYKFKYKGKKNYAKSYAKLMTFKINKKVNFITYVPISKNRYKERGYNQAYLLAKEIGLYLNIEIFKGVKRIKNTKKQRGLSRKARFNNVKDAFEVFDKNKIRGKKILIIDDIYTTGATMEELSKKLLDAGAFEVYCLALCGGRNN